VSRHLAAALSALLVTVFWSSSFLLIKLTLPFIPPATLAALRYALAFAFLLAYALIFDRRRPAGLAWGTLAVIGILQYGAGQALQYSAMRSLPITTVALLFSLLPALQAIADTIWLREPPGVVQVIGGAVTVGGIALYLPWGGAVVWGALLLMAGTLVASTVATTLTRRIARAGSTPTLHITLVSTGAGALCILPVGVLGEPSPQFPPGVVMALLWLALANTAIAFSLWNHALRTLTGFEANVIANTTLFQVGILGWIFLGEPLAGRQVLGMIIAFGGVLLAQVPALRLRGVPASS
jgi:drug/metabolite transporter (DMT)-like permease